MIATRSRSLRRQCRGAQPPRGFTLIELMVAIMVLSILLGIAVPSFRDAALGSRLTGYANDLVAGVQIARSEAIKRNAVVSLCPSSDGDTCAPPGTPWDRGWIVFVNVDRDSPASRDPGEELLHSYPAWTRGRVDANRSTLSFRAFGQSGVTATFTFCDDRGGDAARAVIISQIGRPRVSDRSASGTALACA